MAPARAVETARVTVTATRSRELSNSFDLRHDSESDIPREAPMLILNSPVGDAAHEESGHPERPERLRAALAGVDDLHLDDQLAHAAPHSATRAELARVHDTDYLDRIGNFCYEGGGELDPDTYATHDSWRIAQLAAGAGLSVVDEMERHENAVGFVAVRPPGHHALRDHAMGFCLLNNVAVVTAALRSRGERVAIIDWDVHHGNGTQAIFWNDPNVLFVSTHQWPLYPGSGGAREIGGVDALGLTVNIPLPPGASGDVLLRGFDEIAAPAIDDFAPTWVLVSAGYDGHRADPLANLELSSGDFARMAARVNAVSAGRLALFLEGGYNLDALRASVAATFSTLLGGDFVAEASTNGGAGLEDIDRIRSDRDLALKLAHDVKDADDDS
jgi:acetoin utilization deacetylase AcuC-like enzyme